MPTNTQLLNDGIVVFEEACEEKRINIASLIEDTCLRADPEIVQELPLWYPETHRKALMYDAKRQRVYINTDKLSGHTTQKREPNIKAAKAFWWSIGFTSATKPRNWTVCHIWGVDDPTFQKPNTIIQDPKYYSCIANMVALPTPLKTLTDSLPQIKTMLRVCAYYLYGWVCESSEVQRDAKEIKRGMIPKGYPKSWPRKAGEQPPRGLVPGNDAILKYARSRKNKIMKDLNNRTLLHYPRKQVREVLKFWKIQL